MSMNENININNPGNDDEKFAQKKIFNISGNTSETETRSAPVNTSATGNDLSKESVAASSGNSDNNIDCDLSEENSRDDNTEEKVNNQKAHDNNNPEGGGAECEQSRELSEEASSPKLCSRDDNAEEKVNDQKVLNDDNTEGGGADCEKKKEPTAEASSPIQETIDVDDSDVINPADQNGDNYEKLSAGAVNNNEIQGEGEQSSEKVDNSEHKEEAFEVESLEKANNCEQKEEPVEVDSSDKVDNCERTEEPIEVDNPSTDEADNEETQGYAIDSASTTEDARAHVDYKSEDFNTDSDFDKSSSGDEQKESGDKGAGQDMGLLSSKSETHKDAGASAKKQKCQGSSSEEDSNRPWLNKTKSKVNQKKEGKQNKPSSFQSSRLAHLKRHWSDHDTQMYRAGYPGKKDHPKHNQNLMFYKGEIQSKPSGAFIDEFHEDWWHNHDRLESHHGFIQWLFPIRENGMNWHAQELQPHEAKAIQDDKKLIERFVKSYEMMLYFYGINLVDRKTGQVARAKNWKERFHHLNHSMHNYLRITRILKCLGEMGLEHYKMPFLEFILHEAIITGYLHNTLDSCYNYWIGTVKDDAARANLKQLAECLCKGGEESKDQEEDIAVDSD